MIFYYEYIQIQMNEYGYGDAMLRPAQQTHEFGFEIGKAKQCCSNGAFRCM